MAQDDYYYEIQLTNKQLVFYFLAGATVLIISFLAGIMVGRGVDAHSTEARAVHDEQVLPVTEEPGARTPPVTIESYSYPQRLVADRVPERLEKPAAAAPTPKPKPAERAVATPTPARSTPTPAPTRPPAATPRPAASRPAATPIQAERLVIQVGAFRERSRAEVVKEQLRKKGYPAHVGSAAGERGGLFNVYVGPYSTREQADRVKTRLVEQERFKPFIVRQ